MYKLNPLYSALISARHRMSICPGVWRFQRTTRHIRYQFQCDRSSQFRPRAAATAGLKHGSRCLFSLTMMLCPRSVQPWVSRHTSPLICPCRLSLFSVYHLTIPDLFLFLISCFYSGLYNLSTTSLNWIFDKFQFIHVPSHTLNVSLRSTASSSQYF